MIDNEQQYEATKEQLQKIQEELETIKNDKMALHPVFGAAAIMTLTCYIEELEFRIKVYEMHHTQET